MVGPLSSLGPIPLLPARQVKAVCPVAYRWLSHHREHLPILKRDSMLVCATMPYEFCARGMGREDPGALRAVASSLPRPRSRDPAKDAFLRRTSFAHFA